MKKSTINNFLNDLENIKNYMNHINMVNKIVSNNKHLVSESLNDFNTHIKKFYTEKKLFEYKSIIISLYGLLEYSITNWIQEHVNNIPTLVKKYDNLSEKFKENHFDLSINLLTLIKKYQKYETVDKEKIIMTLNNSNIENVFFTLNSEAYIPLSGNLKHLKIVEAFIPLDIKLEEKLSQYIEQRKLRFCISKINDLVILRNDIAHGNIIQNILGMTEFNEYIDSLKLYGIAIFEILSEKEIEYEVNHSYVKLDDIKEIHANKILDFNISKQNIKKGDYLIIKDGNQYIKKEILDIHINGKSSDNVFLLSETNVCVKVLPKLKSSQIFYIKKLKKENVNTYYPLILVK